MKKLLIYIFIFCALNATAQVLIKGSTFFFPGSDDTGTLTSTLGAETRMKNFGSEILFHYDTYNGDVTRSGAFIHLGNKYYFKKNYIGSLLRYEYRYFNGEYLSAQYNQGISYGITIGRMDKIKGAFGIEYGFYSYYFKFFDNAMNLARFYQQPNWNYGLRLYLYLEFKKKQNNE